MIIRLRSAEGQGRVNIEASDDISVLRKRIAETLKISETTLVLSADEKGQKIIDAKKGTLVGKIGLRHGDILYTAYRREEEQQAPTEDKKITAAVVQDPIDEYMAKQEGTIQRGRDPRFCKHGTSGMCEYCMPLQPWDAKYLEENKIKHMSFHAYLRQITDQNKTAPLTSSQFLPPLDEMDLKVKIPCPSKGHESWPNGICTKCQPSAVTLQSQSFRMVDHIEFETAGMIENFLTFWRSSGYQRFGYLYGRFEQYSEVPLGVKAVVTAIYEPPQEGAYDGLQLTLPNPEETSVDEVATKLGLTKVGMIYTDLTDDGTGNGTVICKRHSESYFLSSAECILAAQMQLKYPTPSKWSATGQFGSRFVTCVMTGNEDGGIDISSFQVSNTAMAMVRDDIVEASVEPSLMRVKQSTNEQYVPEVFYKYKNEYGIMVKDAARPTFPVEYLLVTVTHGFPQNPSPFFTSPVHFPIENRGGVEIQDTAALQRHFSTGKLTDALSDFHALVYLKHLHVIEAPDFELVYQIAKNHSEETANQLVHQSSWQTLLMILNEAGAHGGGVGSYMDAGSGSGASSAATATRASSSTGASWACKYCTFNNAGSADTCEMCGLPKE
ncbi:nuclear protein localization protein 4 [Spizellomyces punctatus DAOM BR117]|uniref:Nuclear protein localization protein 4 n=1 Tax=Spizellomyces punctatus (strain DAOM BR117) TaxID=645134 RepID=A0A0L0HUZ8_SPIPD|nr:nuclear protein localization protein 4 [Spizellomyces punctatus DAOM BR117]KND04917.1 hypothetical protein SPPG_00608 [Spizellomyces punctatus DAOM BR117]|eukprot:XP_016612956.1 hypothetical protein SPPG_00608 [Spizellomyces punctatus DAOM BR117]